MHDSIVQVRSKRGITENEMRSILNIIERYKGKSETEFFDCKNGFDLYVSSVNDGRHIASKILKVVGGELKESSKYLRVQDGRAIRRITFRVRLKETESKAKYGFE